MTNGLPLNVRVAFACAIFWGIGYIAQRFEARSLVYAPRWLQLLCLVPRGDGCLSPLPTAMQLVAYVTPLLALGTGIWLPEGLRLPVFFVAFAGGLVVVSLLVYVLE